MQGHVINPLDPIPTDFWDAMKWNAPNLLLSHTVVLNKIRDLARLSQQVNAMIASREMFRLNQRPDPTATNPSIYFDTIGAYDRLLVTFQDQLLQAVDDLLGALTSDGYSS